MSGLACGRGCQGWISGASRIASISRPSAQPPTAYAAPANPTVTFTRTLNHHHYNNHHPPPSQPYSTPASITVTIITTTTITVATIAVMFTVRTTNVCYGVKQCLVLILRYSLCSPHACKHPALFVRNDISVCKYLIILVHNSRI